MVAIFELENSMGICMKTLKRWGLYSSYMPIHIYNKRCFSHRHLHGGLVDSIC